MASLPEVPGPVRRGAKEDALRATADLLYGGDVSRLDGDLCYYADGFALLARDLQRDAPLLFAPGPLTDKQRAARERLATDLRALLPFSLVVSTTFPFTRALMEPMLRPGVVLGATIPRRWLAPSQWDEERLLRVARARKLTKRAAPATLVE